MAWVISSWMAKIRSGRDHSGRPRLAAVLAIDQLAGDPHPRAGLADASFENEILRRAPSRLPAPPRFALVGERRVPGDHEEPETFERSVMMSSVMPSLKYSCSGSPLMLLNGRTAIDGFSSHCCRRLRRSARRCEGVSNEML